MVVGDTNARVGDACDGKLVDFDNHDFMSVADEFDSLDKNGLLVKPRESNSDKIINSNGDEILSWARGIGLWVLNGRCMPNECTYFAKQGISNCDTWLGSEEILLAAVAGDVSGPLSQSDHAMVKVCLRFWLQPSAQDSFFEFLRFQGSKKHTWKMRRGPLLATLDDNTALQQSLAEYLRNPRIQAASLAMSENLLQAVLKLKNVLLNTLVPSKICLLYNGKALPVKITGVDPNNFRNRGRLGLRSPFSFGKNGGGGEKDMTATRKKLKGLTCWKLRSAYQDSCKKKDGDIKGVIGRQSAD